ncbi:MAG: phage baseplate assembly protein V [Lachnospiraceae bacterium]
MGLFDEMLEESPREAEERGAVYSVAIGVVKENWDAEHPGMVKVELSLGNTGQNLTDWALVLSPYGGNEFGQYFLPEIGSQVLVAFHMGDVNCPIVLGCLWNQTDVIPPETANEKNTVKLIKTKGGNTIRIFEESGKEKITVETKGKLKLEMDDENQKILLQDEKGENGISIDAKNGEMQFTAKKKAGFNINGKEMFTLDGGGQTATVKTGTIDLAADQNLKMKAQTLKQEGSNTEIKGQNIKIESQASLGIKGTASLKAESSGMTEVKGTMVKIN